MNTKTADDILRVEDLKKHYAAEQGFFRKANTYVKAVDGVSFGIQRGETFGLVGESGCGKTTVARLVLRAVEPTDGDVWFKPQGKEAVNLVHLRPRELKGVRKDMQMVFQDPFSSLNPRLTVFSIIAEPLMAHKWKANEQRQRVAELLELVGLSSRDMRRYPHAFSGGQRQRICIARALALSPSLVVADEPVSALDVSVQAQTLNLLNELQNTLGLTYLFISHDLSVVRYVCDTIAVMYLGKLVEQTAVDQLFTAPKHPYTSALIASVPAPNPKKKWQTQTVRGEVSAGGNGVQGCDFAPRCPYKVDECIHKVPGIRNLPASGAKHEAACHRAQELSLKGVE